MSGRAHSHIRPDRPQPERTPVNPIQSGRRIDYAGSVHDEREIEAVVAVLRGGPTALRIGRNVKAMEARVAELFGKRRGVMCNSGSSALYLAVEVLGLEPGDEIVTSAVTFSTDIAPMVRDGIVPAFVDVTPDTFQIDVDAHRGDDRPEDQGHPRPQPDRQRPGLGPHPRDRRPPRPRGGRGLLRRSRPHAARHADRHTVPTSASPASPCRTSSPRPAPAGWCASTTTSWPTGPCCCAGGVGARRCSCSARRRESDDALLLARSTGTSSTTTCSSSTRSAGTSSRPSCRPPSVSSSSTSWPTTWPGGSATSS